MKAFTHLETKVVRAGSPSPRIEGAVVTPIFQSAMFEYAGETSYHDLKYIRLNNTPTQTVLHGKLAAMENGEAALAAASGMAAISTTLLTVLAPGDHLLAQDCLYGGTLDLLNTELAALGIETSFIDADAPASWPALVRPNTRAIYVESLTNPRLDVADLAAVVRFAREHGLVSLIDNTFATPVNFRPLEHGFDLVLHSATKYLNGHSDLVAGCVIGSAALVEKVRHKLIHLGGSADANACFLLQRGVKTLALRVAAHNRNALEIAAWLERHPRVAAVHYPGLASHPQHARARALFAGFGGMMSFELRADAAAADAFLRRLRLVVHTVSLGGVETLATRPAATSHAGLSAEERAAAGIG